MDEGAAEQIRGARDGYTNGPEKPAPPRLTKEERLSLENLALKVENLRLQQERMKQDFVTSTKMLGDLRKEAHEYELVLGSKYGVDFAACTLQSDGSIVPKVTDGR